MRDIVDSIPKKLESNDYENQQTNLNDYENQQTNLNEYKVNEQKLKDDKKNLEKLKKECPIKNSDLVIYDTSKEKCILKQCPNGFIKSVDGKKCEMYIDDIDIYRYKTKHNCGEQYIDWITIPNYHLGNSFFKLNTGNSQDDFNGCFEPCETNFIPYKNIADKDAKVSKDSINCISKSIIDIGRYGKITLDYCPLVLILLLSSDMIENNEFRGEYIKITNNKHIEPVIKDRIKDNDLLLKEMKDTVLLKGKNYIIYLLNKYKPDFLEKLVLTGFELDKCYKTAILNINSDKREPILHAYNVFKNKDTNLNKYANAYKYISNDGDVLALIALHEQVLKWACEVAFDKNTNYGKRNLFLYNKFSNPEETEESIDTKIDYIRKVNKQVIKNENSIFYGLDILHPGKLFKKSVQNEDTNNIMQNSYIIGLPSTIFLLLLFIILIIIIILFYKYTAKIYLHVRRILIRIIYTIANMVNTNISPKYIIKDLLDNVRNQVVKQNTNVI